MELEKRLEEYEDGNFVGMPKKSSQFRKRPSHLVTKQEPISSLDQLSPTSPDEPTGMDIEPNETTANETA